MPAALIAAFSYDRKVLLERYVSGRELAVSLLDGVDGSGSPEVLPIVEAVPEQEDFYDFESRYEIGRTRFVCPGRARARARRRGPASWRSPSTGCSAAAASPASI